MPDVIRQRRQALGFSQQELAQRAGIDVRQVRRYEAGEAQPTLPAAKAIAQALDISLDVLAGGLPNDGLTGSWWMGWSPALGETDSWRVDVHRTATDFEATPSQLSEANERPPWMRMTFKRSASGLVGWFMTTRAVGAAVLNQEGEGWVGRWVTGPGVAAINAGGLSLSQSRETALEMAQSVHAGES